MCPLSDVVERSTCSCTCRGRHGGPTPLTGLSARMFVHADDRNIFRVIVVYSGDVEFAELLDLLGTRIPVLTGGVFPVAPAMRREGDVLCNIARARKEKGMFDSTKEQFSLPSSSSFHLLQPKFKVGYRSAAVQVKCFGHQNQLAVIAPPR